MERDNQHNESRRARQWLTTKRVAVEAASRRTSLAVPRCPIAFALGIVLTNELALLGAAEISLAPVVIDARSRIDPDQLVARTRHTRRRCVYGSLRVERSDQREPQSKEAAQN
jgi:hypothetical protein